MMKNLLRHGANKVKRLLGVGWPSNHSMSTFALSYEEAYQRRVGVALEDIFLSHEGRLAHKWIDYLPIYDRYLSKFRGTKVKLLEIGVSEGGSLQIWRNYLGKKAIIHGIDINPECAERVDPPNRVHIGSQADARFLSKVISEMGAPDIILDDGSHIGEHQIASFQCLWPELSFGGIYIIEDLHTAYWPSYGGGHRRRGTSIDLVKSLIDDMHGWYHSKGSRYAFKEEIGSILVFESMVVLEKKAKCKPGHIKVGGRPAL